MNIEQLLHVHSRLTRALRGESSRSTAYRAGMFAAISERMYGREEAFKPGSQDAKDFEAGLQRGKSIELPMEEPTHA